MPRVGVGEIPNRDWGRTSLAGNIHATLMTGQLKHSVVQHPGKLQHAVGTEAQ